MASVSAPSATLADYFVKKQIDRDLTETLFRQLRLPVPKENEFYETSDRGALIPLNPFGMLIRISIPKLLEESKDAKYRLETVTHPDVIQPVTEFEYGQMHVELLPGVRLGWNNKHAIELKKRLMADGIDFHESAGLSNYGYLPIANDEYPEGIPVVVDRNAVHKRYFNGVIKPAAFPPEEVSNRFDRAWPDKMKTADPHRIMDFWQLCKEMTLSNQLVAGWADDQFKGILYYHAHGDTSEMRKISLRYARSLDAHWARQGVNTREDRSR